MTSVSLFASAMIAAAVSQPAQAEPSARLKAVVLVTSEVDRALLARVRGQTSDLDIDLVEASEPPGPMPLADRVQHADQLTQAEGARVAVWFELPAGTGRAVVYVSETASGRVFARLLGQEGKTPGSDTALLEEAAVVLRGALRALASGAVIGIHREELLAPAPPAAPPPPPPSRAAPAPDEDSGWFVAGGWQVSADGATARGLGAATIDLGLEVGGWEAAVVAALGLSADIEDEYATVRMARHALALRVGRRFPIRSHAEIRASLLGGVVAFDRITVGTADGVRPDRPKLTPSLLVAPEIGAGWHGGGRRTQVAVLAVAALDVTPAAPTLGYDVGGSFEPAHELRRLQPRVGLILRVDVQ